MCRLLGWVTAEPATAREALGDCGFDAFRGLSRQHADGWGMAWTVTSTSDPQAARSTRCAADDPGFERAVADASSESGLLHLRWATPGLPVVPANTHPFVREGRAFAHNGAIHPQDRLAELVPRGWEAALRGTTDSERYFTAILARLAHGDRVVEAVGGVVRDVFARFQPTSLNAMLLDSDALWVVSAFDPARVPSLRSSAGDAERPAEPDSVFYDLHYRVRGGSVLVASSGFPQRAEDGWEPLANMRLLRVERGSLAVSVDSLEAVAVSPSGG